MENMCYYMMHIFELGVIWFYLYAYEILILLLSNETSKVFQTVIHISNLMLHVFSRSRFINDMLDIKFQWKQCFFNMYVNIGLYIYMDWIGKMWNPLHLDIKFCICQVFDYRMKNFNKEMCRLMLIWQPEIKRISKYQYRF